jgi:hypothetical protein
MVSFIDDHRMEYGVEPICAVLPIAPSTYYAHKARAADPSRRSARAQRDDGLKSEIWRVWDANRQVYGAKKVWKQLRREKLAVARCTVERLMRGLGLEGARRGRAFRRTTEPANAAPQPLDRVQRDFSADRPVSDLTYVATWRGFAYVAFVVDVFSRRIVGWRVSSSLRSDLALDALEQAISERQDESGGHVHHSDRGVHRGARSRTSSSQRSSGSGGSIIIGCSNRSDTCRQQSSRKRTTVVSRVRPIRPDSSH